MKTRRQRKYLTATTTKGAGIPLTDSSTNDSESEVIVTKKKRTRGKLPATTNKLIDTYDADSERSSSNEISKETSSLLQDRLKMSSSSPADEYEFVADQDENKNPHKQPTRSQARSKSSKTSCPKLKSQADRLKIITPSPHMPTNVEFKVPEIVNQPTPGLQPSLKRKSSFSAPQRQQQKSSPQTAVLRVSFSDESFSDSTERYRRRYSTERYPSFDYKSPKTVTSTPASAKDNNNKNLKDQQTRPALPRLSDIASPILMEQPDLSLKRVHGSNQHSDYTGQSSGYGSMAKSANHAADTLDGSYISEPVVKKHKPPYKEETEIKPNLPPPPKTKKEKRLQAMAKAKDQEEKYLAELHELEDFDLCIE